MERGLYRLTQDVKNPNADKRTKYNPWCKGVLKTGTRFFVSPKSKEKDLFVETLRMSGVEEEQIDKYIAQSAEVEVRLLGSPRVLSFRVENEDELCGEERTWEVVRNHLEKEDDSLSQVIYESEWGVHGAPTLILMLLLDFGAVSLEDFRECLARVELLDEDGISALEKKHGISLTV